MIGPLFRSPRHAPRATPIAPGGGRRLENAVVHLVERITAPLGAWRRRRIAVERLDAALPSLGGSFDGYRIAFLTDLHLSPVVPEAFVARAVALTLELAPDVILLGGDYLSHDPGYAAALERVLRPLAAPDGVFAVLGNHDHYVSAALVRDVLRRAEIPELRNASITVRRAADALAIGGVGDLRFDAIDFAAVLAGVDERTPRIVVSHDPDVFAYWPAGLRLDLMLSGHTHGGQARLPLIGPPYVPSQFGYRYLAGRIEEAGRQLYVSRGVGLITLPIRWGSPPEVTLVVLHPA